MKKLLIIMMMLLFSIPVYSGCWKHNPKQIWTGGWTPSDFGGAAAYGDNTLFYLEQVPYEDTVRNKFNLGAILWSTKDAGVTFNPVVGYIHNDPTYEADSIRDGYDGYSITSMKKVVLHDENKIYLAGESELLEVSSDGGKTWDIRRVIPSNTGKWLNWRIFNDFDTHPSGLGAFCFEKNEIPWGEGAKYLYDSIAITTDDWKTSKWLNIAKQDTAVYLERVCIADSNTIYVMGCKNSENYPPIICKSSDKGVNWSYYVFENLPKGRFYGISFFNKDTGWIAGVDVKRFRVEEYNIIYKTIDGGKTWQEQYHNNDSTYGGFKYIRFTDSMNGWALANSSKIVVTDSTTDMVLYHTTDGGTTWLREYSNRNGHKMGVAFALAVGSAKNANIILGYNLFQYVDDCSSGVEDQLPPMPEEFKSFPNPIGSNRSGRLQLGNTYGENLEGVYLYDNRGNNISTYISYEMTSDGELNFKLAPELASGAYMITVVFGINRVQYCKIIVE